MSREKSPLQEQAKKLWIKSGKTMKLVEIAAKLGVSDGLIRKWKLYGKWDEEPIKKPRGAPKGNKNAVGNSGGNGAHEGNHFAYKNGFYTKYLPEALAEIADEIEDLDPIEMLWQDIIVLRTKILHGQKITFIRDKEDFTKVLTKDQSSDKGEIQEWEYQHAWDKYNADLKAHASATRDLQGMIHKYMALVEDLGSEEQRLRIQKLAIEVDVLKAGKGPSNTIFDITKPAGMEDE